MAKLQTTKTPEWINISQHYYEVYKNTIPYRDKVDNDDFLKICLEKFNVNSNYFKVKLLDA